MMYLLVTHSEVVETRKMERRLGMRLQAMSYSLALVYAWMALQPFKHTPSLPFQPKDSAVSLLGCTGWCNRSIKDHEYATIRIC